MSRRDKVVRRRALNPIEQGSSSATLDHAVIGQLLTVQGVRAPIAAPEWGRWLEEIGFIIGEQVVLMARALPGGDPLVVRIGQSTFALRRAEAACVRVASVDQAYVEERKV
ncbi:FeoA family protein [Propionivibrio sp.]|uniref:FeoA family protein n=1 Tax=Propionivibrio sp. TaxID=2212460 RepID=UPI0025D1D434|nr:FeoA family protein [Propionivibrio sp.]MBK8744537.1 ferrous iron transport protein A [Propionivibrio sp.]